ncbi:MAG: hypothetical protein HY869_09895 [Chloroflexi bacterium]|nr:hypothetical protein [Chloroflexota bacterium]
MDKLRRSVERHGKEITGSLMFYRVDPGATGPFEALPNSFAQSLANMQPWFKGIRLLRNFNGDNKTFATTGFHYGEVSDSPYILQKGWNIDSNGTGGVVMINGPLSTSSGFALAASIGGLFLAAVPPVNIIGAGLILFSGYGWAISTLSAMESHPVYYPNLPVR